MGETTQDDGDAATHDRRRRQILIASTALGLLLTLFVIVKAASGHPTRLVADWGIAVLEIGLGSVCVWRFVIRGWRSANITIRYMPLFLGAAISLRGVGALLVAIEGTAGTRLTMPSAVDACN